MTTPLPLLLAFSVLVIWTARVGSRPEGFFASEQQQQRPAFPDPLVSQQMIEFKTEVIKSRILSEVNMLEPPPITSPINLPQNIIDLLVRKEIDDAMLGEGENLIVYPVNENITCRNGTPCTRFEFELPADGKPISSMHIWIRKFITNETITVSMCFSDTYGEDKKCDSEEMLNKVKTEVGWEVFELSPKYVLEPRAEPTYCTVRIFGSSIREYGDQKPFIVANMNPRVAERKRRSANSNKNCTCCLMDLYVSFKEIGWHWVVAPLGFSANMCYGKCSYQLNTYPSHYHRMLSTILNNKTATGEKKEALWTPCCSPTKLSPLNMIYVAGNNTISNSSSSFIYHKIPDMITESCGCW